jgi:hypothetical protein
MLRLEKRRNSSQARHVKYFDHLKYTFLQEMFISFGFGREWVIWISNLISFTFFSILFNGSPSHYFNPSQGIHQGDPLSPF